MASMPGYHVSKGPFSNLDRMFNGTDPAVYTNALLMLAGSLEVAAAARFGATSNLVTHFKTHWLSDDNNSNHWKKLQPEATLKAGLTAAIKKAQGTDPDHPKPMEFFWVCADEGEFNVYYSAGDHQVTVIVFTPPPLDATGKPKDDFEDVANLDHPEQLWVVKPEDKYETTSPGVNYPGPITPLVPVPQADPRIIERQIWSN
jgi:hypothetical protein